jgi:excisionase family DNA binding protein
MDRWTVTVEEAAEMLGISRSSAYECVHRGELQALRLGRRLVVPRSALEEMLGGAPGTATVTAETDSAC